MISALPGLLAARLAQEVTQVATATGLFSQPCRAATGDVEFSGPGATQAAVFVQLGAFEHDSEIGARSDGEVITFPFAAEVQLALAGPETVTLDSAQREPPLSVVDGRDLMLSVVTGLLATAKDAGFDAPLSLATLRAGGRKIEAHWRYGHTARPPTVSGVIDTVWP